MQLQIGGGILLLLGLCSRVIAAPLMFAMIVALNYPYRGVTSISPEIWHTMVERSETLHAAA